MAGEPLVLRVVGPGDTSCVPQIDSVSIEGQPPKVVIRAQRPDCQPVQERGAQFKVDVPAAPLAAGQYRVEVQVPRLGEEGFSDYLHPLDGDYVLGVGKDAIPDPGGDFRGAWYQGLKVSLYDVSDPSNPFEADAAIIGKRGSETPVLHDHRAFTFLQGEGSNPRVAIGAVVHEWITPWTSVYPWPFFGWSYSGLHLFEVDTAAGRILRRGEMRVEEYEPTPGGSAWPLIYADDRSVLAGDAIFYVHGDDVYTSLWSNPGLFEGPK